MFRKILLSALFITASAGVAQAQPDAHNYSRVELRAILGIAAFPDDNWSHHSTAGGSLSVRVSSRLLVGPEILYMHGPGEDRDLAIVPLLRYEIGRFSRVQPYVIGGVGLLRNRQRFGTTVYSSNHATYSVGIGAGIDLGGRLFLSPEFRGGWEPLIQASIGIGYRF